MAKRVGPFSPWRRIGQTIATSGQIGLGEDGKLNVGHEGRPAAAPYDVRAAARPLAG